MNGRIRAEMDAPIVERKAGVIAPQLYLSVLRGDDRATDH